VAIIGQAGKETAYIICSNKRTYRWWVMRFVGVILCVIIAFLLHGQVVQYEMLRNLFNVPLDACHCRFI